MKHDNHLLLWNNINLLQYYLNHSFHDIKYFNIIIKNDIKLSETIIKNIAYKSYTYINNINIDFYTLIKNIKYYIIILLCKIIIVEKDFVNLKLKFNNSHEKLLNLLINKIKKVFITFEINTNSNWNNCCNLKDLNNLQQWNEYIKIIYNIIQQNKKKIKQVNLNNDKLKISIDLIYSDCKKLLPNDIINYFSKIKPIWTYFSIFFKQLIWCSSKNIIKSYYLNIIKIYDCVIKLESDIELFNKKILGMRFFQVSRINRDKQNKLINNNFIKILFQENNIQKIKKHIQKIPYMLKSHKEFLNYNKSKQIMESINLILKFISNVDLNNNNSICYLKNLIVLYMIEFLNKISINDEFTLYEKIWEKIIKINFFIKTYITNEKALFYLDNNNWTLFYKVIQNLEKISKSLNEKYIIINKIKSDIDFIEKNNNYYELNKYNVNNIKFLLEQLNMILLKIQKNETIDYNNSIVLDNKVKLYNDENYIIKFLYFQNTFKYHNLLKIIQLLYIIETNIIKL